MNTTSSRWNWSRSTIAFGLTGALVLQATPDLLAQARTARRGGAVKTEEGAAVAGRRGAAVKTEEGAAAVTRRGTVVVGEEGAAATGRYGRGGVVVYEDNDAWRTAAGIAVGVAAGIAIGTMLAKPPKQSTTVVVSQTTYYYDSGTFYTKVMHEGQVVYQVVAPPPGAVITTLPAGCTSVTSGGVAYSKCGTTYYQRVSSGYQVVVLK